MKIGDLVQLKEEHVNGQKEFIGKTGIVLRICDIENDETGEVIADCCYVFWPDLGEKTLGSVDWVEVIA